MTTVYDGHSPSLYHTFVPARTNSHTSSRIHSCTPPPAHAHTPPSDGGLSVKRHHVQDQKRSLLSSTGTTPSSAQISLNTATESSWKSESLARVDATTQNLESEWERFIQTRLPGLRMVIYWLSNLVTLIVTYQQEIRNISWETFQKLKVVEVSGLR
jgi:hypothetical protein